MNIAEEFGKNLHRARKRAGISQEALAVLATLHRTEIGLLERGERLPRIDTAIKLAGALGLPLEKLVEGIEWRPGSTRPGPAVAPTSQLLQPLQSTNPEHTTHWEPSGSMPGPHLFDPQGHEVSRGPFRPGGRRPIVARLRRANGRAYGRPDTLDLRSFAHLKPRLSTGSAMHFVGFVDRGGMERNPSSEPFFTERTLADYLAVSDRTIRNWIRRGDLPSYKLGAARRIDPGDVEDFLARHRDEAA
jgi:excisionase family DNA binding protein